MTKKQVGVLGATSLVGACLLQRLVQDCWPVIAFSRQVMVNRPLKNVFEVADARQKQAKKRSLCMINEHFKPVFNTVAAHYSGHYSMEIKVNFLDNLRLEAKF
ncbi:MAG: hypothetical protein Q8L82_06585, partial [Nitrosomonas sp.]|nr:hypothetical protein [Nitrosomonas sp.]